MTKVFKFLNNLAVIILAVWRGPRTPLQIQESFVDKLASVVETTKAEDLSPEIVTQLLAIEITDSKDIPDLFDELQKLANKVLMPCIETSILAQADYVFDLALMNTEDYVTTVKMIDRTIRAFDLTLSEVIQTKVVAILEKEQEKELLDVPFSNFKHLSAHIGEA